MIDKDFDLCVVNDLPREYGDLDVLETFKFKNNYGFPESYKNFVKEFGYGLVLEEFIVYIPMGNYGDSIFVRSEEIKSYYIDEVYSGEIESWVMQPDGTVEILKRLYPFGFSENVSYLFWDIGSFNNSEFDIFIADFSGGIGFRRVAKDLYELFEKLTDKTQISKCNPFCNIPLKKTFEIFNKE